MPLYASLVSETTSLFSSIMLCECVLLPHNQMNALICFILNCLRPLHYISYILKSQYTIQVLPTVSSANSKCISCCCRILRIPTEELQHHFDTQLPESVKELLTYARNFLEFCSYQTLHVLSSRPDYLSDKEFRRMTFDMMLAWESPCVENKALDKVRKLLPVNSFNIIEILCFLIFNQKLQSIAPLSSTFASCCRLNHLQLQETASSSNQEVEDEDGWSFFYSSSTNMAVQVLLFINFIVFVICKYHIILILFSHRHRMG